MALPATRSELTPPIIAHEFFDKTSTLESRVKARDDLIFLVGRKKASCITSIAFDVVNGMDEITQECKSSELAIEPTIKALEDSKLLLKMQ